MSDEADVSEMVEVELEAVRMHAPTGQHVLLLRERDGERVLPVWVGPFEANAAALRLNGQTPVRPLTHDLAAAILDRTGTTVERVTISRFEEEVYYATVHLTGSAGAQEIDSRPSDAVNLALRARAPIQVAADIMDRAARPRDTSETPSPPSVVVMAVDADTGERLGLVHVRALPEPGDQVAVHTPTGWRVIAVEAAEGEEPPRVLVRRPSAD